jgi:hypothetical protein
VFQAKQTPGSWIITFPMAYHGGFSYGVSEIFPSLAHICFPLIPLPQFNIGEAVNFAIPDWLKYGGLRHPRHPSCLLIIRASGEAGANYRRYARPSVLSFERFLFTARHHMSELPDWAHPMSVLSTSLHSR